jgi:hypothetical protein
LPPVGRGALVEPEVYSLVNHDILAVFNGDGNVKIISQPSLQ